MRTVLLMYLSFLLTSNVFAQESAFKLGVRLSGGYGLHNGIDKILVSEDYYSNYSFEKKGAFVPGATVFLQYHKPQTLFGVEGGIAYYQKAASVHYTDVKELDYTLSMRYHILGVSAYFSVYPMKKGLYVSVGGKAGANLSPRGITYKSNQEDPKFSSYGYGTVSETERLLKDKLTGCADVSLGGGIGYEFPFGLAVDVRYHYNLLNSIKTETNVFRWVEHANHGQQIEFGVSYLLDLK